VKVLVTGAAGVAGRATIAILDEAGVEAVALSSADGDLRDLNVAVQILAREKPAGVIHLAGRVRGLMGNLRHQGEMFYDNSLINLNVVEAARRAEVSSFVAMGTVAMYSDDIARPMREADLWVGRPHGSELGYANAKRSMLGLLEAYALQYDFQYSMALSTNLFGPHDRFDELSGHVMPSLISKFHRGASRGEPVTVWGSGTSTRDFLFSRDAAEALLVMLQKGNGIYNLATGEERSIKQAVDTLSQVSGYRGEILWDKTKPDGQTDRSYDISLLRQLGWAPRTSFEEGVAETYEWFERNNEEARR